MIELKQDVVTRTENYYITATTEFLEGVIGPEDVTAMVKDFCQAMMNKASDYGDHIKILASMFRGMTNIKQCLLLDCLQVQAIQEVAGDSEIPEDIAQIFWDEINFTKHAYLLKRVG